MTNANANAPKPPEAPKVQCMCRQPERLDVVHRVIEPCYIRVDIRRKPAPAPEPDPLTGIDAQRWAQEFMRIWSGRWSEVDESLMIAWFANAIMRGFDEGQNRLRRELQSANPAPAPEPKQGSDEPIDWKSADEWADDWNQFSPVAQANKYILSEVGWNARRAYIALRAELAAKDAEVASLKAEIPARMLRFPQRRLGYRILSLEHELAAEKAAREKAEARVGEDETFISVLIRGCRENGRCTVCHFPEQGHYGGCAVLLASAILAKRQKEESK